MKVDIESVITRTKRRLGLMGTTKWDAEIESLINEGAFHTDSVASFVVNCTTLDIDCYSATLPIGATEVISLSFVGESTCNGCCNSTPYDPENTTGVNILCTCRPYYVFNRDVLTEFNGFGNDACFGGNFFAVQGGAIKFPTTLTATQVKIWYRGYNTDGDGIMILDELQQRGLSAYAAFQFATSGTHMTKYQPYQINEWRKEWTAQKAYFTGKSQQDDWKNNKAKFAAIARAILINPAQVFNNNL